MHSGPTLITNAELILLFLGTLAIASVGLFIYSIVAKRYWLTTILLILPLGLVLLMIPAFYLFSARKIEVREAALTREIEISHPSDQSGFNEIKSVVSPHPEVARGNSRDIGHAEVEDGHSTNYEYSPSEPLTADIYPNLASCGRPLAFQLANDIRNSSQFSSKPVFTIEIIKSKQPNKNLSNDNTHWQPTHHFKSPFTVELLEQFPQSKFVLTKEASAEAINQGFKKMDIQLSHTTSKNDQPSGSVQANWTVDDKPQGKASVNYVEKQWVSSLLSQPRNPSTFAVIYQQPQTNSSSQVIGLTNRLARSPQEASVLAMQTARDFYSYSNSSHSLKVVDRFQQKLSLPYGELWQEAVLVDFDQKRVNTALTPRLGVSPIVPNSHRNSKQRSTWLLSIILVAGTFGVAWASNLLTQGYYRQTINYTLVTAIAVIFALILLALVVT